MVNQALRTHDGVMTEQTTGDADGFDPGRVRTIGDVRRTRDDRMVAGVCAGLARHFNLDPVVVRVVIACLALAGLAGAIIYIAAWLLIPEEGAEHSVLDRHLPENADHEQIRRIGLFAAAAIAAASALGSGYALGPAGLPLTIAALALFYIFAVRPYNRRQAERNPSTESSIATMSTAGGVPVAPADTNTTPPTFVDAPGPLPKRRNPRHDRGMLFGLTLAVMALVIGAMGIYSATVDTIDWPYFPLAALFVVAAGMLTGSYVGNGRPLVWFGIPLALILLATSVVPTYTIGDESHHPAYATDIDDQYEQGVGNFVLDLTGVSDLSTLDGRTIDIDQGVGSLEVIVPDGVNVDVAAETDAGQLKIFGRSTDGAPVSLRHVDPADADPQLHLDISQTLGQVRVSREAARTGALDSERSWAPGSHGAGTRLESDLP